ncbi:MAG: Phosphopantetheine adenylyltransferase, partial [uncultured Nocardioidaceae bacterium]
ATRGLPGVLRPRHPRSPRRHRARRPALRRGRRRGGGQPLEEPAVRPRGPHRDAHRRGRALGQRRGRGLHRPAHRLLHPARRGRGRQGRAGGGGCRLRAADGADERHAGTGRHRLPPDQPPARVPVLEPGQGGGGPRRRRVRDGPGRCPRPAFGRAAAGPV